MTLCRIDAHTAHGVVSGAMITHAISPALRSQASSGVRWADPTLDTPISTIIIGLLP